MASRRSSLQFVQDKTTEFDLAKKFGRGAWDCQTDPPEYWDRGGHKSINCILRSSNRPTSNQKLRPLVAFVLYLATVLHDVGLYPLAYLTANMNGLEEDVVVILEAAGLTDPDVDGVPTFGQCTLKILPIVTPPSASIILLRPCASTTLYKWAKNQKPGLWMGA
ncbi:uncharacterized protein EDB91DRAFT_1256647 [Suillus paluster]|uniref:uncharacterized protein n=1 Tax=Suillus paluster TaxID=48578 RepID=UPI001B874B6B|nr:uncharacterized protein EDB91DRAFT_1256647 [Suillus paluster]KAG1721127.1 hypothetical protein EDB91DRAFT_1256647 [Suillus paluster]